MPAENIATTERRILFEGAWLQVGHVTVRPVSSACGEVETSELNVLALPLAGIFAKHDGPRQQVTATPQHALLISAGRPYRLSFPGCIGDRCLALRFTDEALAHAMPETLPAAAPGGGFAPGTYAAHTLLPPAVMLARSHLWRRLAQGAVEALEVEELVMRLLGDVLRNARKLPARPTRPGLPGHSGSNAARRGARRTRHVHLTLEAIAAQPEHRWTLGQLAAQASVSPSHLAHGFRAEMGLSVYAYVIRSRLARALDAVLDSDAGLTEIALDAGFASHSHFTAKFRALFGHTPLAVRRGIHPNAARQMRRIVTAQEWAAA